MLPNLRRDSLMFCMYMQADRQAGRQAGRPVGGLAGRQQTMAIEQEPRRTGRQTAAVHWAQRRGSLHARRRTSTSTAGGEALRASAGAHPAAEVREDPRGPRAHAVGLEARVAEGLRVPLVRLKHAVAGVTGERHHLLCAGLEERERETKRERERKRGAGRQHEDNGEKEEQTVSTENK